VGSITRRGKTKRTSEGAMPAISSQSSGREIPPPPPPAIRRSHKEEVLFVVLHVFSSIKQRVSFCFHALQERVLRWMMPPTTSLPLGTLADLTRGKAELLAENALLRQQLIILRRQVKRPVYRKTDRFLLVRAAPGWSEPGNRRCSSSNRRHSCEGRVNSSVGSGSANRRCLQESRGFRPRRSA